MDDYVPKPVKPEELETVLQRWILEEGDSASDTEGSHGSVTAAEGTEGPLDRTAIENLRELGGQQMLSELAEMFLGDARSSIRALREAIESSDAISVKQVAHTLKGSSGNMGAARMATICSELQDVGAAGDLSHAPELLERLEEEFGRVRLVLEAQIARS
jgi:HPt (histidine-containing phosphotransfer) domain-containing protein